MSFALTEDEGGSQDRFFGTVQVRHFGGAPVFRSRTDRRRSLGPVADPPPIPCCDTRLSPIPALRSSSGTDRALQYAMRSFEGGADGVLDEAREMSHRFLTRAPAVTARVAMAPQQARMSVQWFVPRGEMGAINSALHVLMVATRAEPGCLSCLLSTQLGDRAGFTYVEEWKTEDDLVTHLRSARFAKLAQLLESATERPRIEFSLPGGIRGIDYAEEVRGQHGEAS